MSKKIADVDTDNFEVTPERQAEVRTEIEKIKESGLLESFRLLAAELGKEEDASASPGQMELLADKAQVYRGAAGTMAEGFASILNGTDLFVRWKSKSLVEVIQLPKAGDFAILHVDRDLWESISALEDALKEDIKLAKKMKADRQSHFKSFGKGNSAASTGA